METLLVMMMMIKWKITTKLALMHQRIDPKIKSKKLELLKNENLKLQPKPRKKRRRSLRKKRKLTLIRKPPRNQLSRSPRKKRLKLTRMLLKGSRWAEWQEASNQNSKH